MAVNCAPSEIHIDDKNVRFLVTIEEDCASVDISMCTAKKIIFQKPDGTTLEKDAEFLTDGTDGIIYYNTVDGDIDICGLWKIQAVIYIGSSSLFHSKIKSFRVYSNL